MKVYILIALFGFLNASKHILKDIKIQEGTDLVKEHIDLDKENGVSILHTGNHGNRKGVTEIIDSVNGIVAEKFDRDAGDNMELLCLIRKFDPTSDMTPNQIAQGLEKAHNKMPKIIEEVFKSYVLEDFESPSSLPQNIRTFCAGLKIVSKKAVSSLEETSEYALKEVIASQKNARKRAVIRSFTTCDIASSIEIRKCQSNVTQLSAVCKIRISSCTYFVNCPIDLVKGGYDCIGVHEFNSINCCDYKCNMY